MAIGDKIRVLDDRSMRAIRDMLQWWKRTGLHLPQGSADTPFDLSTETIPIYNDGASEIPLGGVGQITGIESDNVTCTVEEPVYGATQLLAVATTAIATSARGQARLLGIGPFTVRLSDWATVAVGDRVGPAAAAWPMAEDFMGPFVILAKLTTPLVRVMFGLVPAPPLLKTTSAASGGSIDAKQVNDSFAVTGDARAFITE